MDNKKDRPFNPIGLYIDIEELKKYSRIVIWGRMFMEDKTIGPWTPILQMPIDKDRLAKKSRLIETYISLEKESG